MKVFREGLDNIKRFNKPVVTIGSYDGVHAGHRAILKKIIEQARSKGVESVVITFSPHPRTVLDPSFKIQLLNSMHEKEILLSELGIDNLVIVPFTQEFALTSSYDFIKHYMVGRLNVGTLVVGYNHHFGHNKEGNFDYLTQLQTQFGFDIMKIEKQDVDGGKVSSTIVRQLIGEGKMEEAAHALTQPYFMICRVGDKGLIIPDVPEKILPTDGLYNVMCGTKQTMVRIEQGRAYFTQEMQCTDKSSGFTQSEEFIVKFV